MRIFLLDAQWPPLFFRQITSFSDSFHYTKKQKNLYVGSFNYFSYTIQIRPNWYMDTGVRDLEVSFFMANSTWLNDICSKNLSNKLIYAVLNTHNLEMILQLKYMPTVMNPARIASSYWKSYKCYGLWYALSSKRVRWAPGFFLRFYNLILSFSTCSQSCNKICTWEVLGANVLKVIP